MEDRIESRLCDVPETMLIPLWAKAEESTKPNALLRDEKAREILARIDYDFSKFRKAKMSQVGCCIRAALIDQETQTFLQQHPDAVVIQLGAGIDARYERLQQPPLTHWYDLDLPEGIALRQRVLAESERNTYLSLSLFDYAWIDQVKAHGKPVLIIVEGVLMYFAPEQVRAFFQTLCERFDAGVTVLFDMLAFSLVGHAKQHDSLRSVEGQVDFKWAELYTEQMEAWHEKIKVEREYFMSDYDNGRFPWLFRWLYKIPYFYRRFNQRIVRLRIGA